MSFVTSSVFGGAVAGAVMEAANKNREYKELEKSRLFELQVMDPTAYQRELEKKRVEAERRASMPPRPYKSYTSRQSAQSDSGGDFITGMIIGSLL
tara:strand:- start:8527 stop:8814 length:288 start_codon:yes stop_codon:yes gene_type:complete